MKRKQFLNSIVLIAEGKFEDASNFLKKYLQINVSKIKAYKTLSFCLLKLNKINEAVETFTAGIKSTGSIILLKERANINKNLGKLNEAISDYTEIMKKTDIHLNRILYTRASLYLLLKNVNEAINDFSSILESNPDDVNALLSRGNSYCQQKRFKEALIDFEKVISIDNSNKESLVKAKICKEKINQLETHEVPV